MARYVDLGAEEGKRTAEGEMHAVRRKLLLGQIAGGISMVIAIISAVAAETVFKAPPRTVQEASRSLETNDMAAETKRAAAELRDAINQTQVISPDGQNARALQVLAGRMNDLELREGKLESYLENSPEKALALPLLRKDVDNQAAESVRSQASLQQSIDRVYDLTKTFIVALSIAVIGLVLQGFRPRPQAVPPKSDG